MIDARKYADRAEYMKLAVVKRRKKLKQLSIDYLGGQCQMCGYKRCPAALDFHHKDESQKQFGISAKGYTRSWEAVKAELNGCYLLCANCHREAHAGILQLPSETAVEKSG